jgi:AcrR family transcriptional regulator
MPSGAPARRRPYRGEPPEVRDRRRRRALLDAALEQFGTEGYRGASVEGLCRAAGVSTRNFYALFESREALFLALYDELTAGVLQAVVEAVEAARERPATIVRAGLEAAIRAYVDRPRVARVVLIEVHGISPEVERHRREAIDAVAGVVAGELERLARAAGAPSRHPRLLAIGLVGAVVELLVHRTSHGTGPPVEELVDELERLFVLAVGGEPPSG